MPPEETELPRHIDEAIEAIRTLHDRHQETARPIQKRVEQVTQRLARPSTAIVFLILAAVWIALNSALPRTDAPDPPPYDRLEIVVSLISVTLTCLILTTQRRADVLAAKRAHLTLELALIAEQKSAKTIALIEELRRDLPMLANRADSIAEALSEPTNASAVIDSLTGERGPPEDCGL